MRASEKQRVVALGARLQLLEYLFEWHLGQGTRSHDQHVRRAGQHLPQLAGDQFAEPLGIGGRRCTQACGLDVTGEVRAVRQSEIGRALLGGDIGFIGEAEARLAQQVKSRFQFAQHVTHAIGLARAAQLLAHLGTVFIHERGKARRCSDPLFERRGRDGRRTRAQICKQFVRNHTCRHGIVTS
ncbi:MAG: hypothetical protein E6J26_09825 [Chloroflexi bacterium]|nr:MAG: hypothetical protein E6J26_09825 [Chloroflexota bacterium]